MPSLAFALYDAFSDNIFAGSQAAIVCDAGDLDYAIRQKIASEINVPATGFVIDVNEYTVKARFHSSTTEYPMCGHGTLCMMTRLLELEKINWNGSQQITVELSMPDTTARVEILNQGDKLPLVMLDILPPSFRSDPFDLPRLCELLGLKEKDLSPQWPIETAIGDFVHLIVPLKDLTVMRRIDANFDGLTHFWHDFGIQTIAVFCTETESPSYHLHVRDFCPAVGVAESAAAGTTNSALTSYLVRHGIVQHNTDGQITVIAEQGYEINRPSTIRSVVTMNNHEIARLQVGGVARKVVDGQLFLPIVKADK